MKARTIWIAISLTGASVAAWAGDLLHLPVKVRSRCGLPDHDYQPRPLSLPSDQITFAPLSFVAAPTNAAAAAGTAPRIDVKTFQLRANELRRDHCALTRVAATVTRDNELLVNFRAIQNPVAADGTMTTAVRFKRNGFYVTVRGYGAFPVAADPEGSGLGRPELFRYDVQPFWVDRQQVLDVRETHRIEAFGANWFDQVDRVEIGFRYE